MKIPMMAEILRPGAVGVAELKHETIDAQTAKWSQLRAAINPRRPYDGVEEGTYVELFVKGGLVMSDTQMERSSNQAAIWRAHGDVLIAGLGIGMILIPILNKVNVKTVTVIEVSQDVISLVQPQLVNHLNGTAHKLNVICADAFEWKPAKGQKFQTIYFDIWADRCVDNLEQIKRLHQRAKGWLDRTDPERWMGSWYHNELRQLARCGY